METTYEVSEIFEMRHAETGETRSVFDGSWKGQEGWEKAPSGFADVIHKKTGIKVFGPDSLDKAEKCAAAWEAGKGFNKITGEAFD